MKSLDTLLAARPFPGAHRIAVVVMVLVASFFGWAYFAHFDEVAVAQGVVVPQGQVKVIQHLEGGIIDAIDVAEGKTVSKGDPLMRLELGMNAANKAELQVQIDGLMIKRDRLRAEANGDALKFQSNIDKRMAHIVRNERSIFQNRKRQVASGLEVLKNRSRQKELEVRELETKLRGREASLKLLVQRFAMSKDLRKNELVSKLEHLKLESELETLKTTVSELRSSLPKAQAALAEAREREKTERLNFRRGVLEELGQVEVMIARNRQIMSRASDQATRTVIRSPIDGVVKNLRFHTLGGVVRPGDAIMEIVPTQDALLVEARLSPVDVGYVKVGQPAVVKLVTYDFVRYGGLDGKVINVAPDSSQDREGNPYFRVVVRTEKSYVGDEPNSLPITAGMSSIVDIHTGEKPILEYLISPVLKLKHEAFRER